MIRFFCRISIAPQQNRIRTSEHRRWGASLRAAISLAPFLLIAALVASPGAAPNAGASDPGEGYLLVGSDGGAFAYGTVGFYGPYSKLTLNLPIVGAAVTANGGGYVEAGGDGGTFLFGNAPSDGSIYKFSNQSSQQMGLGNVVGVALTPDNQGYWLATNTGYVCGFGDAVVYYDNNLQYVPETNGCWPSATNSGSMVGIAADPASPNSGYWLVSSTAGVFAFGAAGYHGGTPGITNAVGIAPTADGGGYWIAGSDGGVFAYGDAPFFGSYGATFTNGVVGILAVPAAANDGYWLVHSNGQLLPFGHAAFLGSEEDQTLGGPIVGIA
jgi:hypothetical protein